LSAVLSDCPSTALTVVRLTGSGTQRPIAGTQALTRCWYGANVAKRPSHAITRSLLVWKRCGP
jgi:hypothetical protein